ncbi:MAG: hypothetical protein KBG15_18090 [Kofleriaceae bacterium]|nr:hypothetical protein [Kofleriaceae bacterium]
MSCQKVTSFACGMHDSAGRTFGTAHETTMCSTITLLPDGSFRQSGDLMSTTGNYRLVKRNVELRFAADGDAPAYTNNLILNTAGTQLGNMTLVVASSTNTTTP